MICNHCSLWAATTEKIWQARKNNITHGMVVHKCLFCGGDDWATTKSFIGSCPNVKTMPRKPLSITIGFVPAIAIVLVLALLGWLVTRTITKEHKMKYRSYIVGMKYHDGAYQALAKLQRDQVVNLRRDPDNKYDRNAVRVQTQGDVMLGYVPARVAAEIAPMMDRAETFTVYARFVGNVNEPTITFDVP